MDEMKSQRLVQTDKVLSLIGELKLDYAELFLYDCLMSGQVGAEPGIEPYEVFLRAYQNLFKHLQVLECSFEGLCEACNQIIGKT